MNALPINPASIMPAKAPTGADRDEDNGGQEFATLLSPQQHTSAATPPPRPQSRAQDKPVEQERPREEASQTRQRDNASETDRAEARKHAKASGERDADNGQDQDGKQHDTSSDQDKSTSSATSSHKTGNGQDAGTQQAEASDKQGKTAADAHWPPPGLAGFGMNIAGNLQPTTPAPTQPGALPQDATAAIGAGGGRPGLLPQALQAAMANQAGNNAGVHGAPQPGQPGALPAFTSALAQQVAAAPAANASTLAASTIGNDKAQGIADIKAPDPSALLANQSTNHLATQANRGPDAPFNGSPTPTPNLHGDNFDDALGARMNWLADQKIGHAHIKLNPADLGPVEVRLHLDGDKVNASFTSAHAEVRQALEHSLPRLRDMLGQHGFQLAHADVGSQQHQGNQNGNSSSAGSPALDGIAADEASTAGIPSAVLRARGMLDAYA